jgi:mismatch-specific thymine-DNA glycosylase
MSPSTTSFPPEYNNDDDNRDDEDDDDDMPVHKKTSFNGKLNKYFHQVTKVETVGRNTGLTQKFKSTTTTTTTSSANEASPSVSSPLLRSMTTREIIGPRQRVTRSQSSRAASTPTESGSASENNTATHSSLIPSRQRSSPSSLSSSSSSVKKRKRRSRPETPSSSSSYSLPSLLRDTIPPNLILLLVGVNPGLMTGSTGYAYAHPSNLFWKLLHWSGITTIRHPPSDTYRLPELYSVGNTNIVERPTRDASMLSKAEMDAGVDILEAKIAAQRPEAVCLVGKSIWEAVWRVKHGRRIRKDEFRYGWQGQTENMGITKDWKGSPVFVATTTSGLAAGMSLAEKQAVWNELGRWVVKRREERKAAAAAADISTDSAVSTPASVSASHPANSSRDNSTKGLHHQQLEL